MEKFRNLHSNIKIRIISSFLTRSVGSMLFPCMAIYFSDKINAGASGIIMMLNVACAIVVSLYGGVICDRIGRKQVMVIGQSIQVVTIALMTVANSPWIDSVVLTFIMFILNSVGQGLVSPAAEAMLIDVSTPENRSFVYSLNYWVVNLSVMIGSIFGGLFYKSYRFELYVILTIMTIITTFLLLKMVESTKIKPINKNESVLNHLVKSYQTVAKDKIFLIFCIASLLILSLEFQMYNYVSVRLADHFPERIIHMNGLFTFHLDGLRVRSFLTIINTAVIVLFTLSISNVISKFKSKNVLYIGLFIHVFGFLFVSGSISVSLLIIGIIFQTIGEMVYIPARQTIMAELVKEDKRGAYMAVHGLVFQGAKVMGALGLIVGAQVSTIWMVFIFALLGMSSIFLFGVILEPKFKQIQSEEATY